MATVEGERCFFILKEIKIFLRNTFGQEIPLFYKSIVNFNEHVIDHFVKPKERRIEMKFQIVQINSNTQIIFAS